MFERLFGNREQDPAVMDRIPPGQYRTEKFPVLHYGSVPSTDLARWDFRVYGEVDAPFTLTWEQFRTLPRKTVATDIHCVTRWTKLDTTWEGVPIQEILRLAQVRPSATHVLAHSEQGYTANVPLAVLDDDDVMLADTFDGRPLEKEHGWPLRLLVPKRYFWKSAKWIRGLEFLDHDQLGFWERYGYNNDADPWKEERYSEQDSEAGGILRGAGTQVLGLTPASGQEEAAMLEQFAIHATVAASDLERARAWYAAKLGLEPAMEDPGGLWYRFGDGTWLSVYRTEFAGTARNTQAGWTVTGIEAVMAGLRARGVTFEEYDLGDGMATVDGLLSMGPTRLAGSRTRRATPSRSARSTARSDLPRPIGGRRAGRRRPRATPAHRGSR